MNLSIKWLNEFTKVNVSPREFAEAMTMSGSKVEGYEIEGEKINNIVVGKVLQIDKHPDADKLVVCSIDVGESEPVQIVTGATNLVVGDYIPVCKDNSVLPDGRKIKKGKLRGIMSYGMLCSLGELGLTKHDFPYAVEDGIFVLGDDCDKTIGMDIREAIGLNDTKVEFEITSNRPDCFSVIGLAREAAATFGGQLNLHTPTVKAGNGSSKDMLQVEIHNPELCPVYCARIVKNVNVKPSPRWLRERLRAMGVRPINNIVDITNYVMLEYGQPMHAFDLRFVDGAKINVRLAKNGEQITTLDGVERKLTEKDLVIADSNKPVAIAGVMGGEYSGIMDDTTTIVFESANFSGPSVRITAKSQGMRTDASSRYEKGLDPNACIPALERACELVELLGAGDVMDDIISQVCFEKKNHTIKFEPDWINNFLATNLSQQEMTEILNKVDCIVQDGQIIVPTFRPDLIHKADIAEEVARFYGYNVIESTSISGGAKGKYSERQKFDRNITNTLFALGLDEIMTYSFISPKYYNKIEMPADHKLRKSVVISNPLGEDTSIMRTTALPSMMEILANNYSSRNAEVGLFEIAREYIPTTDDKLPIEQKTLVVGVYGGDFDFFNAKGIAEEVLAKAGITNYDVEATSDEYAFHTGRCALLTINGEKLGTIGEIHPKVAQNYGIGTRVYAITLNMDMLFANSNTEKKYKHLPKYPSVSRDLAVICDENMPVLTLEKAIRSAAGTLLEELKLFDVYQGKQIQGGKKSVAFNLVLRSFESTLTEEQINSVIKKSIKALNQLGAELR